ncbi:YesL family protein [Lentibacillus amyloliquefaciens]|uniref:DUF624 domain-containing protein n=1 Tax=Lentibacillus amyloliquefaciens TaxID=1472767 RepID=A0A0U4FW67_9BACI|nr:DUF624 domain-containing protein [Lentibacillus amyloliquefaciens]ALX50005.1 hypothetical protein AOX59_16315 [Lentibacillus amyloliquefaciens]
MNMFASTLYRIMEWIMRFAYLQLLWIGFTLSGLVILGIYPATAAMFAIIRDWLRGKKDIRIFDTYWKYVKADFLKANLLGIPITAIILVITFNIYFIQVDLTDSLSWTYIPIFTFMLLFLLCLFYLFPVFVHYDLNVGNIMKNTLLIMLISPIHTFLMIISLGAVVFVMIALPALAFIFGCSTYAFITMWLSLNAFNRVERKKHNT